MGRPPDPRFVTGMEANLSGLPRGEVLHTASDLTHPDDELCTQIDQERTVAAGASYGGYAIKCVFFPFRCIALLSIALRSWIQGNPELGFGFKALVCHDGVRTSLHEGKSRVNADR